MDPTWVLTLLLLGAHCAPYIILYSYYSRTSLRLQDVHYKKGGKVPAQKTKNGNRCICVIGFWHLKRGCRQIFRSTTRNFTRKQNSSSGIEVNVPLYERALLSEYQGYLLASHLFYGHLVVARKHIAQFSVLQPCKMLRGGNFNAPETSPKTPCILNCIYLFMSEIFYLRMSEIA